MRAKNYEVTEVGVYAPSPMPVEELRAGEVGYICGSIKQVRDANVGDTITHASAPTAETAARLQSLQPDGLLRHLPGEGENTIMSKMLWKTAGQ